jgi:hypothetical protein
MGVKRLNGSSAGLNHANVATGWVMYFEPLDSVANCQPDINE